MSEEILPYPFKEVKDVGSVPPNDFDFQCFIMFEDGRIALSDGGTVCTDRGQIIGWAHLHEIADFMNTRPDSKPYRHKDFQAYYGNSKDLSFVDKFERKAAQAGFDAARELKEG